ncbi:MAG: hypothetical protein ACOVNU_08590 [Candidatus Kapaibacteriota bacterium]|jgi:hypothetical protein
MMKKKFYYLIEDIDINGDNNADGFIITKYKINSKTNDKIFLRTKYVSIEDFQKKALAIRLKESIAKLKKNITISKKGGFMERHPYVEVVQAAPQISQQQLLVQLEELQKKQNEQQVNPQILLEKLKVLEEKIQSQQNQLQQAIYVPQQQHHVPQQHNVPQQHHAQQQQHNYQYNPVMNNRGFDNYMNNNVVDAPPVIVSLHGKKPSMQDNIVEGFGLGAGFAVADNLVDMFF